MALNSLKLIPSKVAKHFKDMEKGKRVWLIVLIVMVVALVAALSIFLNQKTYTVLYSGMAAEDTGEVLTLLNEMGVDARTQGEDTILVEDGKVDEVRLELAAQGYPSSGINDFSIYSSASGLGTTSAEERVYYKYQLQANLRSTIMLMDKVENAVVNLDLGEDSSFVLSDNEKPATASVLLELKNGEALDGQEVKAITELIATSISGLMPENIRIVDTNARLYTTDTGDEMQTANSQQELTINVQNQLQTQIVNLLSPVFGEDNVLAQVSVTLNFDSSVKNTVEYSTPAGSTEGIVVSMQELVEVIANNTDGTASGIDANGNASQYLESLDENGEAVYYNISRDVNYEVNQTTLQVEEAKGQIVSLSVSVILNSTNIDDYVDEVKNLVATAIGVSPESITVERLPFAAAEAAAEQSAAVAANELAFEEQIASTEQNAQTLRTVIVAVAILVIVIFLFSIIKMLRPQKMEAAGSGGIDIVVGDGDEMPSPSEEDSNTDIEIKDKDSKLNVLEDYIEKNSEAAANLLRNWLNEEVSAMPVREKYTAREKAAILMITIGKESAAKIYKHLTEEEIEQLTLSITSTRRVEPDMKEAITDEFIQMCVAQKYISEGGH